MAHHIPQIFLARHATPDWSRSDLPYHLPPGPPLTPHGENEAVQLGHYLREARVAHIYSSPFERTWRTAQIAAAVAGAPVQLEPGLSEWVPGEDTTAIRTRVWPVWEQAQSLSLEVGPLALITHGGPIALLLEALGLNRAELDQHRRKFDRNNPLPPAGVWKATRGPTDGSWTFSLSFVPQADGQPGLGYA